MQGPMHSVIDEFLFYVTIMLASIACGNNVAILPDLPKICIPFNQSVDIVLLYRALLVTGQGIPDYTLKTLWPTPSVDEVSLRRQHLYSPSPVIAFALTKIYLLRCIILVWSYTSV